jgi:hypothetical protein
MYADQRPLGAIIRWFQHRLGNPRLQLGFDRNLYLLLNATFVDLLSLGDGAAPFLGSLTSHFTPPPDWKEYL